MKVIPITIKGSSPWNEDALIVDEQQQIFGVIDGATSLTPFKGSNGETGGYLAAQIIKSTFEQLLQANQSAEWQLDAALLQANRTIREQMLAHQIDVAHKENLWSACAAVIRVTPNRIEYVQLGDCMLMSVYEDGAIRVVTQDQIAHIDRETYRVWAEGVAAGLETRDQLWAHVQEQIISGRQLVNTTSGYAVLNGQPEAADHLESGRLNRINLKALLLMTDGIYVPKRAGEKPFDPLEVTEFVMQMGLEAYIQWVIDTEEQDPDCLLYPRVKKSDDKTAIWIEL